jgi:hypothetical protein
MEINYTTGIWKKKLEGNQWIIYSPDNEVIASLSKSKKSVGNARIIAASPLMFEALSGLVQLIGDEDLPDNGEFIGAAICDLARSALAVATGNSNWPVN